jgi:hypothetical protein
MKKTENHPQMTEAELKKAVKAAGRSALHLSLGPLIDGFQGRDQGPAPLILCGPASSQHR